MARQLRYCPVCGARIVDELLARFCTACGEGLVPFRESAHTHAARGRVEIALLIVDVPLVILGIIKLLELPLFR